MLGENVKTIENSRLFWLTCWEVCSVQTESTHRCRVRPLEGWLVGVGKESGITPRLHHYTRVSGTTLGR